MGQSGRYIAWFAAALIVAGAGLFVYGLFGYHGAGTEGILYDAGWYPRERWELACGAAMFSAGILIRRSHGDEH